MDTAKPRCPHCDAILPVKFYRFKSYGTKFFCPFCKNPSRLRYERWWIPIVTNMLALAAAMFTKRMVSSSPFSWAGILAYVVVGLSVGLVATHFLMPLCVRFTRL